MARAADQTWMDTVFAIREFLGTKNHDPQSGQSVIVDALRWTREVIPRKGFSGSTVRLEMRAAFRNLPYDDAEEAINRRLIRDPHGRAWYVIMLDDPARLIAEPAVNGRSERA